MMELNASFCKMETLLLWKLYAKEMGIMWDLDLVLGNFYHQGHLMFKPDFVSELW